MLAATIRGEKVLSHRRKPHSDSVSVFPPGAWPLPGGEAPGSVAADFLGGGDSACLLRAQPEEGAVFHGALHGFCECFLPSRNGSRRGTRKRTIAAAFASGGGSRHADSTASRFKRGPGKSVWRSSCPRDASVVAGCSLVRLERGDRRFWGLCWRSPLLSRACVGASAQRGRRTEPYYKRVESVDNSEYPVRAR